MLLRCKALRSTKTVRAQPDEDGSCSTRLRVGVSRLRLAERIRTDNGTPFASRGAGGLSRLSIWWVKLGIYHERIEPGHPEQNGRHERMHRTLKQETLRPPASTVRTQQTRFDAFQEEFNQERPHEGSTTKRPRRATRRPSESSSNWETSAEETGGAPFGAGARRTPPTTVFHGGAPPLPASAAWAPSARSPLRFVSTRSRASSAASAATARSWAFASSSGIGESAAIPALTLSSLACANLQRSSSVPKPTSGSQPGSG